MGNWFDGLAKRSARSAQVAGSEAGVSDGGLTRRQVLARGAVVTGVAWTAPMLLAARPANAVGASSCPPNNDFVVCPDGTSKCCPEGEVCGTFPNGDVDCSIPLGGVCGNQGQGVDTCNFGRSRCNQPTGNPAENPSICGGPGAVCDPDSTEQVCIDGVECSDGTVGGDMRCGGQGAACDGDEDCADATVEEPATTCQNGVCTA